MALAMRFLMNHGPNAGGTLDIPYGSHSGGAWAQGDPVPLTWIGTTAEKALPSVPITSMFDTTLGKPIFRVGDNPARWIDIGGNAV